MFRPKTYTRRARPVRSDCLRTEAEMQTDARLRAQLLHAASLQGALAAHLSAQRFLDQCSFIEPSTEEQIQEAFGAPLGPYEPVPKGSQT